MLLLGWSIFVGFGQAFAMSDCAAKAAMSIQFTPRPIADARTSSQVLLCLSADSRDEVDDIVDKAVAAGGMADPSPKDEFDFMYGRSFEDLDGHMWGVTWMDVAAATTQPDLAIA